MGGVVLILHQFKLICELLSLAETFREDLEMFLFTGIS